MSSQTERGKRPLTKHLQTTLPLLLFLCILIAAGWARFERIAQQGITTGDPFRYVTEAKLWAYGDPPNFLRHRFYRPTAYFLEGLAIRFGGYNDYSIKVMQASMDLANILLIFGIATALCRSYWVGTATALLYAFLPHVIFLARSAYPQTISVTFTLLAFLFCVCFDRQTKAKRQLTLLSCALLFTSGLCLGLAANAHADVAFLGPGYVGYLLLTAVLNRRSTPRILRTFVSHASIFTFAFFSPYLAGFALFGFAEVIRVLGAEFTTVQHAIAAKYGHPSKLRVALNVLDVPLKSFLGNSLPAVVALCGVPIIMTYRAARKAEGSAIGYLPALLVLAYVVGYTSFASNFSRPHARLYPLLSGVYPRAHS